MNMFLSQAAPELDLLGPQQRKYMHEQCHGGREGVTGIIFYTFLGASWGIIFIGIGPCWGRNLQKHHVEKRFAYHPVETRLLPCPSGGPRRKRKTTGQEENGRRRQEENGRRQAKKRTGHESLVRCRCGQCTGDGPQAQNTEQ